MPIDTWDEIRTAFQVARLGTVSGAAEVLGVHHATVIRHVDALEKRLGVRLFQRHARGYTPTEAGQDLLRVAQATDDQFSQFAARIRGLGETVTGELVVTSLPDLAPLLTPVLVGFQALHPGLIVRYLTDIRLFKLEYGEAHVAIRAGRALDEPDNVVQPFLQICYALYAARSYVEQFGLPEDEAALASHRFVGPDGDGSRVPFFRWLAQVVPPQALTFRTTDMRAMTEALLSGAGIGFLPVWVARGNAELVEVLPSRKEWEVEVRLVTHVDLHRTAKVQSFLAYLKREAKSWPMA
ncbi:MAG: LysR family transcriptional regulator [Rhodobacteraceae bacterium]|nr:LysR family transcriptional regulator [Paracoccaceae bacterium]